jgi:hypothetical protein
MKVRSIAREGYLRGYTRERKREGLQASIDKLPNEFKSCLNDYNYRNDGDFAVIDENDYGYL